MVEVFSNLVYGHSITNMSPEHPIMTQDNHRPLAYDHIYVTGQEARNERRTLWVILLTVTMMAIEIIAGYFSNSMALLADGWHMATHTLALSITAFAYMFSRKHARNPSYSFGTGKVNALGSFSSAVTLAIIALIVIAESVIRLYSPLTIHFNEAIGVAVVGLLVNIASAFILKDDSYHHGGMHAHHHDHHHHHRDHNLYAAYLHVVTDAFTSILAIIALLLGKYLGWIRMDATIGILGGIVIGYWAFGLLKQTSNILLDRSPDSELEKEIRRIIKTDAQAELVDFHLWHIGPNDYAAILSIITHTPHPPSYYKNMLTHIGRLSHTTIEVHPA